MNNQFEKRLSKLEAVMPTAGTELTWNEIDEMARQAFSEEEFLKYKRALAIYEATDFTSEEPGKWPELTDEQREALSTVNEALLKLGL